ncbi:hypothetical protein A7981_01065 [Methylovorus sp. MM2]|uniref:YidB family protein n=1 Tax=Methylovorus sp. MM2 TaxID=1848038 RepID=UPI0007E1BAE2|nr:YidB family protein [Methylovorus sp. MM2]OAM52109.1 hypothetical protein A7981_01065 [Methylovorus sp. MM2]
MGLFDRIAGSVASKFAGANGPMIQLAIDLFNEHGGLVGVLDKFKAQGFADEVASWLGDGENLPIKPAQVQKVLGRETLQDIASKFEMSAKEVSEKLAEYLPKVVDRLSPDGKVPVSQSALLLQAMSLFKS